MVQVTYPGVYIQEKSSGVHTITGVATSIAAFVGFTRKGTVDKAVAITSYADFERSHGGLTRDSPLSYAVRQFFLNGGTQAYIVRVASGYATAAWTLNDAGATVLTVSASSPGAWGNDLRLSVDLTNVKNKSSDFTLVVKQIPTPGAAPVTIETHRNLSLDPFSAQYVASVVNSASSALRVDVNPALAFGDLGFAVSGPLVLTVPSNRTISGTLNGTRSFALAVAAPPLPATSWATNGDFVNAVKDAITAGGYAADLKASETDQDGNAGTGHLKLESQLAGASSSVVIAAGSFGDLAASIKMGLANGGVERPGAAEHRPVAVADAAPTTSGIDGGPGTETQLKGDESTKTGIYALLDVDLFNLLAIPETFDMTGAGAGGLLIPAALDLCDRRRAFYLIDPPSNRTLADIVAWAQTFQSERPADHGASYFPPVRIIDPLDGLRPRSMAPSGTLAGVYARTDATRGVWKAPAGTDANLNGVIDLGRPMSDLENGQINPKGVNALRSFPAYGRVAWGARTMKGNDDVGSEYKYVPIRRLALFLEESLYRGTQWVVFEPNDEPLWSQIRLNLGVFMNGLFRQGAFQGKTPQEAYFVKCDKETTTQADRNLGIVNILVGFAPLKPAEFVVLTIQQIAGDLQ